MVAKIELATRQHIEDNWIKFQQYREGTKSHAVRGRSLNESDVRAVLERLLTDVLGYEPEQIDREPDFADFLILYRGMKLIVIETKDWGVFDNEKALENALKQAANYADRHKVKRIFVFDGEKVIQALRSELSIKVVANANISGEPPFNDLFYFTQYGLEKTPQTATLTINYSGESTEEIPYKTHHGIRLPYTCFAYIGDLRDKKTWKMPYRNEDGSVDTGRIDKAVNFLLKKSGYRGITATNESVPETAQPDVARKLAIAYQELGQWEPHSKYKSVNLLWDYLNSRGETDLK